MKVFKMNDFDLVCAETEEQAKIFYCEESGIDMGDVEEFFQGEVSLEEKMLVSVDDLPEEEKMMTQLNMKNIGGELFVYKPFSWVIKHQNITSPCIIATTEF
ncbi:hypothetical protein C0966_00655 [Bacillus methanolicus]|uniref:hypothetical protein n=1 Tax=Bacillus methanolicus TaxID=1471 RepID=UPI00238063B4|nr:hypothetical protein [Bacillus methanolicus]MDE3837918.1 hypothetical protein [Bacillus methanolicus]